MGGRVELLADADRPGGWLLLVDRVRQSYVDLDDPTYLDFEYVQAFADVLDALPDGRLAVTHLGGGAGTLARYVAAVRPGSPQLVLEPDAEVTALVRARLPFGRGARIRIRPVDARTGLAGLGDASADVVVLDAFAGGQVPAELTTAECLAQLARVLKQSGGPPASKGVAGGGGVLLVNLADGPSPARGGVAGGGGTGPGLYYTRRVAATIRGVLPEVLVQADPAVFKGRRFGNVVLAAARTGLPAEAIARAAAGAPFPRRVLAGAALARFVGGARPLTDADPMRSPEPPDELWRVGG